MALTCEFVLFTVLLYTGGYFSSSLAILTDAAHMLSDFASFLISLFSLWMATRQPSKRMSFGWHRAGNVYLWCIVGLLVFILCYMVSNNWVCVWY